MSLASSKLPLRSLGKTKLEVTVVGFGGIPIQIVPEETAVAAVCRAYELGINFFDTARGYTNSEERIGKALANREVIIATKSGNRQAEAIYRDVKISLASLGRDYIDLYQLHGVSRHPRHGECAGGGGECSDCSRILLHRRGNGCDRADENRVGPAHLPPLPLLRTLPAGSAD